MKFYNYALSHNLIGRYDKKWDLLILTTVPDFSLTSGKVYGLSGLESEESKPGINEILERTSKLSVEITTDFLASDFKSLLPMTSNDATRPYLMGIYIDSDNNGIIATDGCILRITKVDHIHHAQESIIIPSAAIKEALKGKGKFLTLSKLEGEYYSLTCGNVRVIFKPIKREYPKYQSIIPKAILHHSVVIGAEDLAWIKIVCKAARADKIKVPVIKISNGEMTALDGKMHRFLPTSADCPTTYFNAFLMADALQEGFLNISGELTVAMQKIGNITNLIMPVRG